MNWEFTKSELKFNYESWMNIHMNEMSITPIYLPNVNSNQINM